LPDWRGPVTVTTGKPWSKVRMRGSAWRGIIEIENAN